MKQGMFCFRYLLNLKELFEVYCYGSRKCVCLPKGVNELHVYVTPRQMQDARLEK